MTIEKAFESFMQISFKRAVELSTIASWGGSGYSVELFNDGSYRVLWNSNIGNLYDTSGIILNIPHLNENEIDDDLEILYLDRVREKMIDKFEQYKKDYETTNLL